MLYLDAFDLPALAGLPERKIHTRVSERCFAAEDLGNESRGTGASGSRLGEATI